MPSLTDVYVTVRPDTENFDRDLSRRLRKIDGKKEGRRVGLGFSQSLGGGLRVGMSGIARTIVGPLAAAAAAVGGIKMFAGFITEARESEKIGRLTAQTIKSMGGVANISAAQVSKLAEQISNKTAVDDEAIQSGANLLLTFGNVRNEVGKGNDIFNRAVALTNDMSVALGVDMKGASLQVGKALNDPIKGVTALTRAGVSFTQQQKDQIRTLVEAGDTLGAQKIILGELSKQFGGAAAAAADPMERLRVVAGNLGERIGTALLPHIQRFATYVADKVVPAVSRFLQGMEDGTGAGGRFATFVRDDALPVLRGFAGFVKDSVVPRLQDLAKYIRDEVIPRIREFAGWVENDLLPALVQFWKIVAPGVMAVLKAAGGLFTVVGRTIRDLTKDTDSGNSSWKRYGDWFIKALPYIAKFVELGLKVVAANLKILGAGISAVIRVGDAWLSAWRAVVSGVLKAFLAIVQPILDGAAKAFSWIPGLGDRIKTAQAEFRRFKDNVNAQLGGIKDRDVKIRAQLDSGAKYLAQSRGISASEAAALARKLFAAGGAVHGPGTGTSDSIPAMLSNGEHVWTADEVRKAGGHSAVESLRKAVRGYATGGPVQFNLRAHMPSTRDLERLAGDVNASSLRLINEGRSALGTMRDAFNKAGAAAAAVPGDMPGASPNGEGRLGPRAAAAAQIVRDLFGFRGTIGGYAYRTIGGTNQLSKHALGKAIDVMVYSNKRLGDQIARYFASPGVRERLGVDNVIWYRRITNRGRGWQWGDYNGASPHTDHPHIDFFDRGGVATGTGYLPKRTVRPERVLSPEQTQAFDRLVAVLEKGLPRSGAVVNFNSPVESPRDVRRAVLQANHVIELLNLGG